MLSEEEEEHQLPSIDSLGLSALARKNDTVFMENKIQEQPARLDLELSWGRSNNVEVVNAIMARVIYAVRGYPGYLVLKNDNKIQIFYI